MSATTTHCPLPPLPAEVFPMLLGQMFTSMWRSSCSTDEVAERLGLSHDTVVSWARHYRAAGVALDELPREEGRVRYILQKTLRLSEQRREAARRAEEQARQDGAAPPRP